MKMRKKIACAMAITIAFGTMTACGPKTPPIDDKKSQLSVGIFLAGLGTTWLDESIKDFQEYYANTSFEENKMGVQVSKVALTEQFKPANLAATMENLENAIYFLDQGGYEMFLSKGLLADITETIKEDIYDEDGNFAKDTGKEATLSILDTMHDEWVGYHERDGKYYAIPYRVGVSGIIYDADLFDDNGYYFFNDGTLGAKQSDIDLGEDGTIGTGPDGVVGTADDGMPVTWNDFIKLMKKMANEDDVIPFTWPGATEYQRWYAYESIWANYQGYSDYALNYSFKGKTTDGQDVNEENFKEILINQEGRKAAIQAFHDIMSSTKYYSSNAMTQAHGQAQFEYIDSVNATKRIAMYMDGGYWESEARTHFNTAAIIDENMGYGKRDFRLMPIPNFVGTAGITDQTNTAEKEVLLGRGQNSIVCIPAKNKAGNPEVALKLAKLFLQFVQSREQLSQFVRDTGGCFRTFDFKATEEEVKEYTKFGQSIYHYIEEGSKIMPDLMTSNKRAAIAASGEHLWSFQVKIDNIAINNVASVFAKYPNLSVEDCFEKLKTRLQEV